MTIAPTTTAAPVSTVGSFVVDSDADDVAVAAAAAAPVVVVVFVERLRRRPQNECCRCSSDSRDWLRWHCPPVVPSTWPAFDEAVAVCASHVMVGDGSDCWSLAVRHLDSAIRCDSRRQRVGLRRRRLNYSRRRRRSPCQQLSRSSNVNDSDVIAVVDGRNWALVLRLPMVVPPRRS